jgi:hypothetical protein
MFHKLPESNLTWKDAGALRSAARTIQKSNVSRLFDLLALLGLMANVVPAAVTSSHWPAAHDVLHLPQAALLRSGRAQSFDFFQQRSGPIFERLDQFLPRCDFHFAVAAGCCFLQTRPRGIETRADAVPLKQLGLRTCHRRILRSNAASVGFSE